MRSLPLLLRLPRLPPPPLPPLPSPPRPGPPETATPVPASPPSRLESSTPTPSLRVSYSSVQEFPPSSRRVGDERGTRQTRLRRGRCCRFLARLAAVRPGPYSALMSCSRSVLGQG